MTSDVDHRQMPQQELLPQPPCPPRPSRVAIWASGAAALAHAAVASAHFGEWASGSFFVVIAAAQGWLAFALARNRPSVPVLISAVVVNVAVISLYVVSRTAGLPVGPHHDGRNHHHPGEVVAAEAVESVGSLDLATLVAELVLVVALIDMMPRHLIGKTTSALMVAGTAFWALSAAGLLG